MSSDTIRAAMQTGYRLTNVETYPLMSEETTAYSATITKDGRPIGTIRNDGRGGADLPRFNTAADRKDYETAAKAADPAEDEPWATEEAFAGNLLTHALMAREVEAEQGTVFQRPEDGDWLDTLTFRVSRHPREAMMAALRQREGWRIWDSEAGDFQPVN